MKSVFSVLVLATVVGALLWGFTGAFWFFAAPAFVLVGWITLGVVLINRADKKIEESVRNLAKAQKAPISFNGKQFY